jgi:nicotinate-nucleotide adenylyltransferase
MRHSTYFKIRSYNARVRIGILGGTFDPPHIGHLVIADQARAQLKLDKVWFTPVGQPPHKSNTSDAIHRVNMTKLAMGGNLNFDLCLVDVERPAPHYTVDLFVLLHARYPEHEFNFIIGADTLIDLPRWQRPKQLLELTKIAVAHRPRYQPDLADLEQKLPGISQRIAWVDTPLTDLASNDLQRRAREGLPLRYVVTRDVADYIREQELYR